MEGGSLRALFLLLYRFKGILNLSREVSRNGTRVEEAAQGRIVAVAALEELQVCSWRRSAGLMR